MSAALQRILGNRWTTTAILMVLSAGMAVTDMAFVDRHLRENVLRDVRLLRQTLDNQEVLSLAGSPADLPTPIYQRLKGQLAALCDVRRDYRCIYLIARRRVQPGQPAPADLAENPLMFLLDSEPIDSPNYGAPGQPLAPVNREDMQYYDQDRP